MTATMERCIESWCKIYPSIQEDGSAFKAIESVLERRLEGDFEDFLYTLFNSDLELRLEALLEAQDQDVYPISAQPDLIFETINYKRIVSELETIRVALSKIEAITSSPTWWGDFLFNIVPTHSRKADSMKLRAHLYQHMDVKNIYRLRYGKPVLLLEDLCMEWTVQTLDSALNSEHSNFQGFKAIYQKVKPLFEFHPKEFIPSILHLAEIKKGQDQIESPTTLWEEWYWPLCGLPALFDHSPDPHNFDKRHFLKTMSSWTNTRDPIQGLSRILFSLGLQFTWSPSIHEYASIKDQKKIELFYLASKLDPGCVFYGIPPELIRKTLQEHFVLGMKHKFCAACSKLEFILGFPLNPEEKKNCQAKECNCECKEALKDAHIFEFCMGKNPLEDCWGGSWGMYQLFGRKTTHDLADFEPL